MNHFHREDIETSLASRFEKQVVLYPQQPAIVCKGHTVNYSNLNKMANRVANTILQKYGVKQEPIPVILEENSIDYIVAMLGILKAGKAYSVLNPDLPKPYLQQILDNMNPRMILSTRSFAYLFEFPVLLLDDILQESSCDTNPCVEISPDTLASIVYTSGSTARPKGVMRSQKTILHRIWLYTNAHDVHHQDRQSKLFSCRFVASEVDLYGAILNGATLYNYYFREDGLDMGDWLVDNAITLFHPPVPVFRRFLYSLKEKLHLPSLRLVALAGEALYKSDAELFWRYFPEHCKLCHRYSATEASNMTQFTFDLHTDLPENIVPVGFPVHDKEVYIVDDNGNPVPPQTQGEIVVKSHYLATGYWNESKTGFTTAEDGRSVYHTGDTGRFTEDGLLIHMGRLDHQLKVNGYRVNTQEIEAALLQHPDLSEVAIVADKNVSQENVLTAYLVSKSRSNIDNMREFVQQKLPEYMVPSFYHQVEKIPLTDNGKFDRKSLNIIQQQPKEVALPSNETQRILLEMWQNVLQNQEIGIDDNFFDCGGFSLQAVHLCDQIEKKYGIKIPLATLIMTPTVRKLAEVLESQGHRQFWSPVVTIKQQGDLAPLFCVHGIGGEVLLFQNFTRHLASTRPLYGIQSPLFDEQQFCYSTMEDLATYYVSEIRKVQQQGPFYLAGMCIGGLIAFEMAQILIRQGEQVHFLGILDSIHVPGMQGYSSRKQNKITKIKDITMSLLSGDFRLLPKIWRRLTKWDRNSLEDVRRKARRDKRKVMLKMRDNYKPQTFPGNLVFFCSQQNHDLYSTKQRWQELTLQKFSYEVIPGTHRSMFEEPNVGGLVDKIQSYMSHSDE